jgi:hypothetical protein
MLECPRCGNEAEYVAGEVFVLVWCGFCDDVIEVGDLELHTAAPTFAGSNGHRPLTPGHRGEEAVSHDELAHTGGS